MVPPQKTGSSHLKHDVQGNFFDSNCIEMGVEAVEMDLEDGKLQNIMKLISIEKSRDELFTSRRSQYKCVCYLNTMFKGKISIVSAFRWV